MPKPQYRRRTQEEIQKILSDLADSGLSQLKFASQRGISYSTLQSWVKKRRSAKTSSLPAVIPVGSFSQSTATIEIELPAGNIVRLHPGFSREDLQDVLGILIRC